MHRRSGVRTSARVVLLMTAVPCCCCADRSKKPGVSGRRGAEVVVHRRGPGDGVSGWPRPPPELAEETGLALADMTRTYLATRRGL